MSIAMEQITCRLPTDVIQQLDDMADDRDISRSECLRELLDTQIHGDPMEEKYEESQKEVERLQTEVERLRRANRQILEMREENQQLKEYASNDVEWHEAALLTRLKWYVYGKD